MRTIESFIVTGFGLLIETTAPNFMLEYSVCAFLSMMVCHLLRLLDGRRRAKAIPNVLFLVIGPIWFWMEMIYKEWLVRDLVYSIRHTKFRLGMRDGM